MSRWFMLPTILPSVIAVLLGAPAWSEPQRGMEAIKQGDYATALHEFRILAERGDAIAQYNLGTMYALGQGTETNYVLAASWFLRAAEQGIAEAQGKLGVMYTHGLGVAKDDLQAYVWYSIAAAQGYAIARMPRDELAKQLTPAQLAQAHRLAQEWLAKHSS